MFENIYYDPEAFDLEIVATHELQSEPYEFDLVVVWRDLSTGRLLVGWDSGCSCPEPFEDESRSDLKELESYIPFRDTVIRRSDNDPTQFLEEVRAAWRRT